MKKQAMRMVIIVAAIGLAAKSQASIETYDVTFTGSGWSASGQIDVSGDATGGVATSGYLDVTYGSTTIDYGYLATGVGNVENNNGDVIAIGDNLVSLTAADPFDQSGLLFVQTPINGGGNTPAFLELSADQNNGYVPNIYGSGNAPAGWGYENPNVDGTVSLVAVLEPTSTTAYAGLSALGMVGLVSLRRKFSTIA